MEIVGDPDCAHAPELRRELDALALRPGERLVLDLSGMTFRDSSGITAMIAARSRAEASGAGLRARRRTGLHPARAAHRGPGPDLPSLLRSRLRHRHRVGTGRRPGERGCPRTAVQ
ncbi:STAS domain-containing protein [Streptomyces roseolus]|uniref:STAS domain-containing protein n=1 Tax=Streptomyces roseolus TaxID=67358 RepID=UPI0035712769